MIAWHDASPAMPGIDTAPVARFDDLRAGRSFVLRDQVVERSVSEIPDVVSLLDSAEEQARSGLWVAVVLTYEACAAFDAAFPRRPLPPGLPLAWMSAFRSREQVAPLTPAPSPTVVDVRRRGGSGWFTRGVMLCEPAGLFHQVRLGWGLLVDSGSSAVNLDGLVVLTLTYGYPALLVSGAVDYS